MTRIQKDLDPKKDARALKVKKETVKDLDPKKAARDVKGGVTGRSGAACGQATYGTETGTL